MDNRVRTVIALMNVNLHRDLTLSEMTQSGQLSPSHLRQLFKAEAGMSLARYLKKLRLYRARELLETTFLSVKEIAAKVGLHSINHFVTDFKKAHGVTPSQFAARYRKTAPARENRQIR
jgi:transcriptional regulator GlxA family with amidase domain